MVAAIFGSAQPRCSRPSSQHLLAAALIAAAVPAGAADYRLLKLDGVHLKWGAPELGTGAEVSYGFATAEQSFPDAINCRVLAPMAELAPAWGDDPARLAEMAAGAFAIWSREVDLRFPAGGGGRGARHPDRRRRASRRGSPSPTSGTGRAPGRDGAADPGDHLPQPARRLVGRRRGRRRRGRSICGPCSRTRSATPSGSTTPAPTGALMGFSNQGDIDHLMPGDIAGAVALYGPARN